MSPERQLLRAQALAILETLVGIEELGVVDESSIERPKAPYFRTVASVVLGENGVPSSRDLRRDFDPISAGRLAGLLDLLEDVVLVMRPVP